jgi:hypothetical protein
LRQQRGTKYIYSPGSVNRTRAVLTFNIKLLYINPLSLSSTNLFPLLSRADNKASLLWIHYESGRLNFINTLFFYTPFIAADATGATLCRLFTAPNITELTDETRKGKSTQCLNNAVKEKNDSYYKSKCNLISNGCGNYAGGHAVAVTNKCKQDKNFSFKTGISRKIYERFCRTKILLLKKIK